MNEQPTLQAPLADELGPPSSDVDAVVARTWSRIEHTRERRAAKRPLFALGGALVGAAVATAVAVFVLSPPPADPSNGAPKSAWASTLNLSASSRVELAADAEMELLSSSPEEVRLRLDEGLVRVTVDPDEKRRWTISAQPEPVPDRVCPSVDVLVIGTVFTVDRQEGGADPRVEVAVERGVVEMRRAGKVQRIRAQEKHTMPLACMAPGTSVTTPDVPAKAALAPASPEAVEPPPKAVDPKPAPAPSEPAAPESTQLVVPKPAAVKVATDKRVSGRAKKARSRREKEPVVATPAPTPKETPPASVAPSPVEEAPAPKPPSVSELLARADRARASGDRSGAKTILKDILATRAKESGASTAAYMLARLHASAGQPANAARAYERAVRMGLPSALREAASAAAFQAWLASGRRDAARKAAARYVKKYPSGRWSAKARELLGPPNL